MVCFVSLDYQRTQQDSDKPLNVAAIKSTNSTRISFCHLLQRLQFFQESLQHLFINCLSLFIISFRNKITHLIVAGTFYTCTNKNNVDDITNDFYLFPCHSYNYWFCSVLPVTILFLYRIYPCIIRTLFTRFVVEKSRCVLYTEPFVSRSLPSFA